MRRLALAPLLLLALGGCSSPRPPAAAPVAAGVAGPPVPVAAAPPAPDPAFATFPVASGPAGARDPLPLSIKRLVAEQQSEMNDVIGLAGPVGDARGRARAAREVSALADELRAIEARLRAGSVESEQLDAVVVKLQRLQTRIALLHDALRVASGPNAAVQLEESGAAPR